MAERSANSLDSIMSDLKKGKFAPVYILMGEESYYIDKIADYITNNVLQPEERDFNQTIVFGADVTSGQVADMAKRYPMMSEKQVIVVKEAQSLKNWDRIEAYMEKPQPTTILVICYKNGTIDGRKKILSKAKAVGVVFESKKKRESELPLFIEHYLKTAAGVTIDTKSVQIIAEHIGADLSRLTSELDKLVLALPETDKRITPEVVERQVGISKEFNAYELRNAIAQRNVLKANRIVNYFEKNPKTGGAFVLLPMLFGYFQNLMLAYYAPNRTDENEVARWLDLRAGWAARDYMTGMKNYSGVKVMQIISKLRETDAKCKGLDNPNTPIGELMKELVFFIMH